MKIATQLVLTLGSTAVLSALAGAAAAAASEPAADAGPFVVGGERRHARIVVEQELPRKQRQAPSDLARYLEAITGVRVPVATGLDAAADRLTIRIGRGAYAARHIPRFGSLSIDGYVIKLVDRDNLVLAGGENLGTGFAVYDFLKIICGCRWFMPGPLGEVIPRRETIVLDGIDIRSEPSVPSVWVRPIHIDNLKLKHFRRYHWAGHNLARLVPPQTHGEAHPEYYPLLNGRRLVPLGASRTPWQPCVTNGEVPRLLPAVAHEWFSRNPYSQVFSIGVNDGGGDCLCAVCTARDAIDDGVRIMSDRYAEFVVRCASLMARTFPERWLGTHAYGGLFTPPRHVRFPENLYVRIGGRRKVLDAFDTWSGLVPHLGVYEFVYGTPVREPRHYPHVLGAYLKTLVSKYGIVSFAAEAFPFWPFDAAKLYVLHELLWDIDRDVDELLDDFFSTCYGEAAAGMAAFFQRMEDVYRRREDQTFFFDGWQHAGFHGWTLADIEAMNAALDSARRQARDPAVVDRVKMVDDAWQHIRCELRVYVETARLNAMQIGSPAAAETAVGSARVIYGCRREEAAWDARTLEVSNYPSEDYHRFYVAHHYAKRTSGVETESQAENAVERVFELISRLPGGDAEAFWRRTRQQVEAPGLAALVETQIHALRRGVPAPNLIANGDFEDTEQRQQAPGEAASAEFRWRRVKDLPAGYAVWSFTARPARFVWTDRLAHSGGRCIGIEQNEVKASFIRHLAVAPHERYRISVMATRVWSGTILDLNPSVAVGWQGVIEGRQKWLDVPRLTHVIGIPSSGDWRAGVLRVTVPREATAMVLMLGINGSQLGGGGTYFDDLDVRCVLQPGGEQ